jgi:hypothetical protein
MAKTSQLNELTGPNLAPNDFLQVVSVADPSMGNTGSNRKITIANLASGLSGIGTLQATITPGTINQYWRGDKTWQTLDKNTIGLGNVDNESKVTMFTNPTFTGTITLPTGTVTSDMILDGTIVNDDISSSAAIDQSKIANLGNDLSLKANIASPTFTGTPAAPTALISTNTTQIATTEFVQTALENLKFVHNQKGQSIILDNHTTESLGLSDLYDSNCKVAVNANGTRVAIATIKYGIHIYDYVNGLWTKTATLTFSDYLPSGNIYSIAMNKSGTVIAFNASSSSGIYFVDAYTLQGSSWIQLGSRISLVNVNASGNSRPICMNDAGTRIAVGEGSHDTPFNNCGRVRIYDFIVSEWTNIANITGLRAQAGVGSYGLAMSGDGNRIAVGAGGEYLPNIYGYVAVYDSSSNWSTLGTVFTSSVSYASTLFDNVSLNEDGTVLAFTERHLTYIYKYTGVSWVRHGFTNTYPSDDIDYYTTDRFSGALPTGICKLNSAGNMIVIIRAIGGSTVNKTDFRNAITVYKLVGGSWHSLSLDSIYGSHSKEYLGISTALSGDGMTFIAQGIDGSISTNSIVWTQIGSDINGKAAGELSGWEMSMNTAGDRIAFGATGADTGGLTDRGVVRVYAKSLNSTAWIQLGSDILGEAANDYSGRSVDINAVGDRVVIGAMSNDGGGTNSGHVRVYRYNSSGSGWTQLGQEIDGISNEGQFGISCSINAAGDRVAGGANLAGPSGGHVRVFSLVGSTWTQLGQTLTGTGALPQSFGEEIHLNDIGDRIMITSPTSGGGTSTGSIFVYSLIGSTWTQLGQTIVGLEVGSQAGRGASMNAAGDRIAFGDRGVGTGVVRIFQLTGNTWTQMGSNIVAAGAEDFGTNCKLNAAGDRVAISASTNDEGGQDSGCVRLYQWDGSGWTQLGSDIRGEAANDNSGRGLSINGAGDRVVIGAMSNDGGGQDSGHVRVFEIQSIDTISTLKTINKVYTVSDSFSSLNYPNNYNYLYDL